MSLFKKASDKKVDNEPETFDASTQNHMRTTEEMVAFIKKFGFGKGMTEKWNAKHFNLITDSLGKNEYVLLAFVGIHNYISMSKHENNFAYAVTNKRLIFAQQRLVGNVIKSINMDKLNDVGKKRGALLGIISFDTLSEAFNVAVDKYTIDRIADAINQIIYLDKNHTNDHITQSKTSSSLEELKQLANLHDQGILTDEEFSAKKKQLLGL